MNSTEKNLHRDLHDLKNIVLNFNLLILNAVAKAPENAKICDFLHFLTVRVRDVSDADKKFVNCSIKHFYYCLLFN